MSERTTKLRCAVYTRKSSEEGLDQTFNSLDAQREACEAYIASQAGLGWRLLPGRYDDGGLSGGTMDRPALQQLLDAVRRGRVDVIVVYKIDRLTRSLMDFARMVEIFDGAKVSFVSVTQQFNTTTSMGRLTLNVLLSFAQFEREVTAERIRDKIAASKRKGMWMGGTVPLGYRAENRKLVVEPKAAAIVRHLFERYLELGSVPKLAAEVNRPSGVRSCFGGAGAESTASLTAESEGGSLAVQQAAAASVVSVSEIEGMPSDLPDAPPAAMGRRISNGQLTYLLRNPIYVGLIRHGEETHPGEHEAIVLQETFDAVQAKLTGQAQRPSGSIGRPDVHLLAGLLFDSGGTKLRPTHATKAGRRYRYYVADAAAERGADAPGSSLRLPASEIERLVLSELTKVLADAKLLSDWIGATGRIRHLPEGLSVARPLQRELADPTPTDRLRNLVRRMVRRVEIADANLVLNLDRSTIIDLLLGGPVAVPAEMRGEQSTALDEPHRVGVIRGDDVHVLTIPMTMRRRGVERKLIVEGPDAGAPRYDRTLIEMVARAHLYLQATTIEGLDRRAVAARFGTYAEDVGRILPLAFLSPKLTDEIMTGRQPSDLSARRLLRDADIPLCWADQNLSLLS